MRGPRSAVCRAVLVTSIVWVLLDVIVLLHYIDPASNSNSQRQALRAERTDVDQKLQLSDDANDRPHGPPGIIPQPHNENEQIERENNVNPNDRLYLEKLMRVSAFERDNSNGAQGGAVQVPDELKELKDKRFKENQFNVMASEMISVNRTLPDIRSDKCKANAGDYVDMKLPKTSIVIVFHNEAWTTLLRTLHSVCNRSPLHLIEEIILVDDMSDKDYLKGPLDLYLKRFPVSIRIIHLTERSGLIRARLVGSEASKGKVLLFLDAHVEVTEGWLEPLVGRVAANRKIVVAPIIDVISDDDFEYITASETTWGGFNWHLNFRWYSVPQREMKRRNFDKSSPIQTPTIAGGLFAIDKAYFYEIGSYDEGMEVWGGENLEISFRVWMCGGSLEIHPCSRVGHVFRKQTPYTFPGGTAKVIHHNAARTAEVWMDQYKDFFYKMAPSARRVEKGDLSARQKLRKDLHCKDFRWYLENIYPEASVPAAYLSLGQISSNGVCIDTVGQKAGGTVKTGGCHGQGGNQAFALTQLGELRFDDLCLTPTKAMLSDSSVKLVKCSTNGAPNNKHLWKYDTQTAQLIHRSSQMCVTAGDGDRLTLTRCNDGEDQKWILEGYNDLEITNDE